MLAAEARAQGVEAHVGEVSRLARHRLGGAARRPRRSRPRPCRSRSTCASPTPSRRTGPESPRAMSFLDRFIHRLRPASSPSAPRPPRGLRPSTPRPSRGPGAPSSSSGCSASAASSPTGCSSGAQARPAASSCRGSCSTRRRSSRSPSPRRRAGRGHARPLLVQHLDELSRRGVRPRASGGRGGQRAGARALPPPAASRDRAAGGLLPQARRDAGRGADHGLGPIARAGPVPYKPPRGVGQPWPHAT